MANNRMWIVNKHTKERVLVAKYYPSTGWYVFNEDLVKNLDALFDTDSAPPSCFGNNDWQLEYEMNNSPTST